MKNFLLTGEKNSGKSTAVYKMVRNASFSCGGVLSLPVISNGAKIGIDALDIMTGESKALARVGGDFKGIEMGRYKISGKGIKHGENAINRAIGNCKLVVIDEIGPLELNGRGWIKAAEYALESESNVFIVVRSQLRDAFIEKYGKYGLNVINFNGISLSELQKKLCEKRT
ncbi:MAG: nucleoside-triphosphatase [Candidatus Thermoplasmatota archaeon]|nr:nucleoside-triphosphatase [Candidatus Thermoplasmatota archaeon]